MDSAARALLQPAVDQAKMAFCSTIRYALFCGNNMNSLQRQVGQLQSRLKDKKKKLEEAEREDQIATFEFENWEENVKRIEENAKDLETEFENMTTCIWGCTPNIVSRAQLSKNAEQLKISAKELYENIPQISRRFDPYLFVQRQTCKPLVGRDSMLQQLQQLALDDTKSTIGIYGMAGVGKTELLNKFFNDFHQKNPNHCIIWVDMKDCHSIEDTQKAISRRLALHWNENDKQEARAARIRWNLNKKSLLLILDDVWVAMDFKDVGIPIATQETKSKVIVATRREDICDTLEATKLHVECLKSGEGRSLFIDKAGRELIESEPEIQHQAEILVEKCGGLPLALVTMGRAMATKRTPGLWKHAVTTLENTPQKIRGMNEVLSCLKRSYDSLDDGKLKTCLLYCTMFPEGKKFPKQHIVDYCIGEGVLADRFYDGDHVYNEGYNLLNILKSASMLENVGPSYFMKMHPMVRILSHWIESGNEETKCLIRAGKELIEAPAVDDWRGIERISLMYNKIETLFEKPDSPSLLTLLLRGNPLNKICDGFFRSMTNLRVLDLRSTSIQEVPAEIGELIQLQHLDIAHTNITSLPKELGNLIKLRYLDLSGTPHLKIIPEGLIEKLSKLRVLYMYWSYDGWKVDTAGQGLGYDELHCLKRLKSLGITVSTLAALRKLARSNRLANCVIFLEIKDCPGLSNTLSTERLGNYFKALQRLTLQRCFTLDELSIDRSLEGRSALKDLNVLRLRELPRAKITWNGGHLQNLKVLFIEDCGKVRHLLHSDDESTEEDDEEEMVREINALPNLSELYLFGLRELESLSCGKRPLAFPSLLLLHVRNCPKLKKIPLNAEKLVKIRGQRCWWNKLEWPEDNDDKKSKFQSIFKEKLPPKSYDERPAAAAAGLEMVFQDSVLEQLQQLAVDDGLSIIGIYGMAGVGKTALLDNFFYQFHCRDEYTMIRIDMDISHSVEDTQKAVAKKLGVIGHKDKSREELAHSISQFLNQKNFILILDNVWEVVDLNAIGIPITICQIKHKVILATRIEDICDRMVASKLHIKCWEWNEAWSLFVEKVGQKLIDSDPVIRKNATSLVERCGGLPLALVTIGRVMAKKRTPEMWENAVKALENNPQQIRGMTDVFSCLKRSFDRLVDDNLRTCLFYCAMLWGDCDIPKESITNYLVGEGVLDGIDLYNEGQKLLHVLKANSMLLDGSNHNFVKVQPMIRIFAMWNAGDSMLMRAEKGLTEIPDVVEWRGAKRILLFHNKIKVLSGSPESPALLTLILYNNPIKKICSGFFQYMKNLRVLDLSITSIQEVPVEIGELITLQYLNLSSTRISSLPKELGNLTRLRFLGLGSTLCLKNIPEGLISCLTDLHSLNMFHNYTGWKVDVGGDGVDFAELHCLKLLKAIGMTVTTAITWKKLIASPRLANCTNPLEINLSQGLVTLSTATIGSEFKALKSLVLRQCNDLQELVIDNDSCAELCTLPDLQCIRLRQLPIAKIAWRSGCLQGLISLQISKCGGIRQLIHCDDEPIEEGEAMKEINILPNLQHLFLFYLPELVSLSCGSKPLAFPSLQFLRVANCPKLKKLPLNAGKLQRIYGQRSWWNRLEWSTADNMEAKYKSIFRSRAFN